MKSGPPLWSSCQSSWLQIQRSGFDSRRYQIFWEVVGLERGPLSLVSTTEELLGRKSSGSGLENRDYSRRDSSRWPRGTLYPQKLALTSLTSCGHSVEFARGLRPREFSFIIKSVLNWSSAFLDTVSVRLLYCSVVQRISSCNITGHVFQIVALSSVYERLLHINILGSFQTWMIIR
jgi:hypothetical protein